VSIRLALPVDRILPEAVAALEKNHCLVLQASPGSGKTTRLPPALLRARFRGDAQEILVLEPRRLAAKYSARRVAEELDAKLGELVGYQFRFENVSGPATRLRFLTEGMLMRRLIGDPELRGVAAVVLDEFHERHLHTDLSLAYLRWLQLSRRPDLRLVVMSATLDTEAISSFLGGCPVLRVEAPVHPVRQLYLPSAPARGLETAVRDGVAQVLKEPECVKGHVLVFLPGMAEIRRAADTLSSLAAREGLWVVPLHGELSREEQDQALAPGGHRKIILATNVAETSLTIEGVTAVVDSGLHRQATYSWWSGVPALKTRSVSRASAIQRAGRAGRTAPGVCLRLYTRGDFDSRPPFDTPELHRADLSQSVLELKRIGVGDVGSFPWFERPQNTLLEASCGLLYRLGALDAPGLAAGVTSLGRRMAELPAHPRVARMLLEAERAGCVGPAARLAALLGEGLGLDALGEAARARLEGGARKTAEQLERAIAGGGAAGRGADLGLGRGPRELEFCVLSGFPDRVARRRRGGDERAAEIELVLAAGGAARVENAPAVMGSDTFVALDIQEQQGLGQARAQLRVRSLVPVEADWLLDLSPSFVADKEEVIWDAQRERVNAVSRMVYDQLVLDESELAPPLPTSLQQDAAKLLLKNALGIDPTRVSGLSTHDWLDALGKVTDRELLECSVARVSLLAKHFPDLGIPDPLAGSWLEWMAPLLSQHLSAKSLREMDWPAEVIAQLGGNAFSRLDALVPSHVALQRGRRVKVNYSLSLPPWIESRLQDFFGMRKGPAVLDGRLPLTLHLLAPNQRAVQVTTDLAGFWQRSYPDLRRELGRRYPRHAWPENPLDPLPDR